MKKHQILKVFILLLGAVSIAGAVQAQNKARNKAEKNELTVTGVVVNEAGVPIKDVAVTAGGGSSTVFTDEAGNYSIKTKPTSPVVYVAKGYETRIIYLAEDGIPTLVELFVAPPYASANDQVNRGDGETQLARDNVGAVSNVIVDNLKTYPDFSLSNALQGQAAGLIVRSGNGGFGSNSASLFIRGQHTTGNSNALIIIDGVPRNIDNIIAEEVESIEILKDATAKMLYGSLAANGVVLVTTKRGHQGQNTVKVSVESGVFQSIDVPEFLGAYEYATLYNEARVYDGLAPRYTASQLEGYKNSTGAHDPLYPDVDWYGEFLHKQSNFTKATVDFNGGNRVVQYALVAGYTFGQGLEKVGQRSTLNDINIRGNLDIRINKSITFKADVAGTIFTSKWGLRNNATFMSTLSTSKPNEYALTLSPEFLGLEPSEDGIPYFGGSTRKVNNLYADLAYSGNNSQTDAYTQMNVGLDFNLNTLVKGLSADAYFTFDHYNSLLQRYEQVYPTYGVREYFDAAGQSQVEITQLKKLSLSTDQNINSSAIIRVMGLRGNIAYNRTFGDHSIGAVLAARYFMQENPTVTQDIKDLNLTLRLNYDYAKKYFLEVALGRMGSSNYYGTMNQFMFAPTAGVSWLVSNENFLSDVSWLDHLKVKASAGIMGVSTDVTPVPYNFSWMDDGTWTFGSGNGSASRVLKASTLGNPDLEWEKHKEFNVGIEAMLLDRRLSTEVNYFASRRENITRRNTLLSSAIGDFFWYDNFGQVTNRGIDAFVNWGDEIGRDFSYSVGVNFTWSKNRIDEIDEAPGIEPYKSRIGKPTSSNITLRSAGMFGPAGSGMVDIASHPFQTFGPVQAGDLAYKDLNNDNIIDGRDQEMIGQSFPLTVWGMDIKLNYKGFGLYVLGTAETGVQKFATTKYFHNYGEDGYSALARDAWHAERNPNGTQPRLSTTTATGNNWRDSEFWAKNGSFFRLKNIELSYTFTGRHAFFDYLKLYVRGTNLFVVSPMKDVDPERLLAGIDNYPMYRAFTGGVSITF